MACGRTASGRETREMELYIVGHRGPGDGGG